MRELCITILLSIGVLCFCIPVSAKGEEETVLGISDIEEVRDEDQNTQKVVNEVLSIDDENIYKDMDIAYKDGYEPVIEDGIATIVLPLYAEDDTDISSIKAIPNLGDTTVSPFVFKNYQKTFYRTNERMYNSGEEKSIFLVRFDLELQNERKNGAYPVTIQVDYDTQEGAISQSFTCYVQITDGVAVNADDNLDDGDSEEPVDVLGDSGAAGDVGEQGGADNVAKEDKKTSEPKVILYQCTDMPEKIESGAEVAFTALLKNTNKVKYVQNMTVTLSCESDSIVLLSNSNVFYFESLGAGDTLEVPISLKIDEKTPAGKYVINLEMSYDNPDASPLTSSGKIEMNVTQKIDTKLEIGAISAEVNAGDMIKIPVQAMNLGRGEIYNVRCVLDVPGLTAEKSLFLGNMEGGSAASGEISAFAGMVSADSGSADERYGKTSGTVVLTYEGESGKEYTQTGELSVTINPLKVNASLKEGKNEKVVGRQMVTGIFILAAIAAVGTAVPLVMRWRTKRKMYE